MHNIVIPSAAEVRAALQPLARQQLIRLAALSGVPFTTVQKIQRGETTDPRLDTVRQLLPHIEAAQQPATLPPATVASNAVAHQPASGDLARAA